MRVKEKPEELEKWKTNLNNWVIELPARSSFHSQMLWRRFTEPRLFSTKFYGGHTVERQTEWDDIDTLLLEDEEYTSLGQALDHAWRNTVADGFDTINKIMNFYFAHAGFNKQVWVGMALLEDGNPMLRVSMLLFLQMKLRRVYADTLGMVHFEHDALPMSATEREVDDTAEEIKARMNETAEQCKKIAIERSMKHNLTWDMNIEAL